MSDKLEIDLRIEFFEANYVFFSKLLRGMVSTETIFRRIKL